MSFVCLKQKNHASQHVASLPDKGTAPLAGQTSVSVWTTLHRRLVGPGHQHPASEPSGFCTETPEQDRRGNTRKSGPIPYTLMRCCWSSYVKLTLPNLCLVPFFIHVYFKLQNHTTDSEKYSRNTTWRQSVGILNTVFFDR